jgi:apolipoprotein N-acyltransferase
MPRAAQQRLLAQRSRFNCRSCGMTAVPASAPLRGHAPRFAYALIAAPFLGAISVLAFAPFRAWWIAPLTLGALFLLVARADSPRRALGIGWLFGMGLNLFGVAWIYVSLHDVGGMPAPLAGTSLAGFCGYLALYPAVAAWAIRQFASAHPLRFTLAAPAFWVVCEWLKATVMTGFPWLNFGTSQVESPLLRGYAPILGAYGLSFCLAAVAAALVIAVSPYGRRWRASMVGGAAFIALAGIALGQITWTKATGPAVRVSLLQGNVEQVLKWREGEREKALENYLELAQQNPATLVVLPETALPMTYERLPIDYLANLKSTATSGNSGAVIVGAVTRHFHDNAFDYFNTAVVLARGNLPPEQRYSKAHLVAFGEFVPPMFGWVYRWLNIPMASFSRADQLQMPVQLSWGRAAINLCYEDAFGDEIIRQLPDANVLINLTNVAWFGRSSAADQHAQFSQLRALETGRPVLRATNTGVTAMIDDRGRITAQLPQFTRGALVGSFVPMQGATPYVGWGDSPALLLVVLCMGWAVWRQGAAGA